MLNPIHLEELRQKLQEIDTNDSSEDLQDWTIDHYQDLIKLLGEYFSHVNNMPWTVNDAWIIKTAYILHKLLENFDQGKYHSSLRENLKVPLSIASARVDDIDKMARRGREFYKDLFDLGDKLSDFHQAIPFAKLT